MSGHNESDHDTPAAHSAAPLPVLRGAGPPTERQVLLRFAFFTVTIAVAGLLLLYLTWTGSQTLGLFLVRMGLVAWVFYAIWQANRSRSEVMAALDRLVKDAGRKRG